MSGVVLAADLSFAAERSAGSDMPTEQTIAESAAPSVRLGSAVARIPLTTPRGGSVTCGRLADLAATHRIHLVIERLAGSVPPGTSFGVSICAAKQRFANAGALNFFDVAADKSAVTFDVSAVFDDLQEFIRRQPATVVISPQSPAFGDAGPGLGRIRVVASPRN